MCNGTGKKKRKRRTTKNQKIRKILTSLETYIDSGTVFHLCQQLTGGAYEKLVQIIGIGGNQASQRSGDFGTLKHAIEVPLTPANLVSAGKLLEDAKWHHFKITKDPLDPSIQRWVGVLHNGDGILLATRDKTTGYLYKATPAVGHQSVPLTDHHQRQYVTKSKAFAFPAVKSRRIAADREERNVLDGVVQQLAYPQMKTIKELNAHFDPPLRIETEDIAAHSKRSREAMLLGSMTNPRKRNLTLIQQIAKKREREKLIFFESITADTFDLVHADHLGRKKGYLICDRKTGTPWVTLYKSDSELPTILQQFLVNTQDKWRLKLNIPDLRCSRIKMDGLTAQTSVVMKTMLAKMGVALTPVPPQYHRASGFIEVRIKRIKMIAQSLWNGLGYKIPKILFPRSFVVAAHIVDLLPDFSHDGNKSSYEMREGRKPSKEDLPRTLYSTVYWKNPDATNNKIGNPSIGINCGAGPIGTDAHYVWDPKTDRIKLRKGCIFDESFSTMPKDRIKRMREGQQVHSIHDETHLHPNTRADAKLKTKQKRTVSYLPKGTKYASLPYNVLSQINGSVEKGYECPVDGCSSAYKSTGGIRSHATSKLKKGNSMDEQHKVWLKKFIGKPSSVNKSAPTGTNDSTIPANSSVSTNSITSSSSTSSSSATPTTSATSNTNSSTASTKQPTKRKRERSKAATKSRPAATRRLRKPIVRFTAGAAMLSSIPDAVDLHVSDISTDAPPPGCENNRFYSYSPALAHIERNQLNNYQSQDPYLRDLEEYSKAPGFHASVLGGVPEGLPSKYHRNLWGYSDEQVYEGTAYHHDPANPSFNLPTTIALAVQSGDSDLHTESKINEAYENIVYQPDPTPQYQPDSPFVTVRSMLGAEDDGGILFEDRLPMYQGVQGNLDPVNEIMGFAVNVVEEKYDTETNAMVLTEENAGRNTPNSIGQAMKSPYWEFGIKQAVEAELGVMNSYNVFARAVLPTGRNLVNLKWVFKIKFENGLMTKWKARLCAVGIKKLLQAGLDYDPSRCSSPVARSHTYMSTLAEAAYLGYKCFFFDVKSAYLLAELNEQVFVRLPPSLDIKLDPARNTNCLVLKKSLYGLPQAGFNHHERFTKQLLDIGFHRSHVDPCLFLLDRHGEHLKLVLWVDDAMVTTSSEALWEYVRDTIHKDSPLSKHGKLDWILGMKVVQDLEKGTITIDQSSKIRAILETYNRPGSTYKPKATPLPTNWTSKEGWMPGTDDEKEATVRAARSNGLSQCASYSHFITSYRECLGSVAYLASWGRVDLKQSIFLLARYQANPGINHWKGLIHILKYLSGTADLPFVVGGQKFVDANGEEEILRAQVDSDYCGHISNTKSTTGYVIFFYGTCIYAESRKQRSTTLSTTEAELVAASDCARMLRYIRRLITEDFRIVLPPTPLGEDNQGCIHLAHDGGDWKRKRHIRVANSYLYEEVTIHKTIAIKYVPSSENCADMMTKCLPKDTFQKHRAVLMGHGANNQ